MYVNGKGQDNINSNLFALVSVSQRKGVGDKVPRS